MSVFKEAYISECGKFRYTLHREWGSGKGWVNFVMLNPSTADAFKDDPTIRRCMGFAQSWGYGGIVVTNLFAFRSPSPAELKKQIHPEGGEENKAALWDSAVASELVIAAWGTHGAYRGRAKAVCHLLRDFDLKCLGVTAEGHPRHPLYLPANQKPEPLRPTPESAP